MTIGRICQRDVDLVESSDTAQAAAQRMDARCVGSLVVVDTHKHPVGILTDRDLALKVVGRGADPSTVVVGELMSPNPETVPETTPIEQALGIMRKHGVRRLPVVGFDERLVGVVSLDDILALIAEEFEQVQALIQKTSPQRLAKE